MEIRAGTLFLNMSKRISLSRVCWFAACMSWMAAGIKMIKEPDFWWQLRTGEWMLQHQSVTYRDVFSYTYSGTDWINVKWLYEVLLALWVQMSSPEFSHVLQLLANFLMFYFLWRSCREMDLKRQSDLKPALFALISVAALFCCNIRMNGRPEMSSHVLTAVYLYIFFHSQNRKESRLIFALIPLQLMWTNLHEAYGTGMVMILVMVCGSWFDHYLDKGANPSAYAKKVSLAGLLSILAVSVNPRGPVMLLHPFEIFQQVKENTFTTELVPYTDPARICTLY
jgi:hypothetical protein